MHDYTIRMIENPRLTTLSSGLFGMFLVLDITLIVGFAVSRKNVKK
jgi:hypothetical protein